MPGLAYLTSLIGGSTAFQFRLLHEHETDLLVNPLLAKRPMVKGRLQIKVTMVFEETSDLTGGLPLVVPSNIDLIYKKSE